jgi:hypothetical protein
VQDFLNSYLNYIVAIISFLIFGIIGGLILMLRKAKRNTLRPAVPAAETNKPESEKKEEKAFDFRPLSLRRSFFNAMRRIKNHVASKYYRTQVPWFMMIGETNSGKTTVLEYTGLDFAISEPDEVRGNHEGLNWYFFDHGIVLDVAGEYVLRADAGPSEDKGWQRLLKLVQRYRPDRPLNGIILTIPCSDLIGPPSQLPNRLVIARDKATSLYNKLWDAQRILGICMPVYILVTKCDHIIGFKSLCSELTEERHNDMFGWSNPYNVSTGFQPHWVDEAFQSIMSNLAELQFEIYAEKENIRDFDGVFRIPLEFQQMKETLKVYLTHLVKQTAYHDSFFLRGIYFCGDKLMESGAVPLPSGGQPELDEEETPEDIKVSPDLVENEASAEESPDLSPVLVSEPQRHPVFTTDLFEEKIFAESDLAKPAANTFLSKNRVVRITQLVTLFLFVVFSGGLMYGYDSLNTEESQLYTLLTDVKTDLQQVHQITGRNGDGDDQELRDHSNRILRGMENVSSSQFRSVFIPNSWLSDIQDDIRESIVSAFNFVILGSLRLGLENRTRMILSERFDANVSILASINDFGDLDKNTRLYNKICKPGQGSLDELNTLLGYLDYTPLPPDFDRENQLFQEALRIAEGESLAVDLVYRYGPSKVARRVDSVAEIALVSGTLSAAMLNDISMSENELKEPELAWLANTPFSTESPFYGMTIGDAVGRFKMVMGGLMASGAITEIEDEVALAIGTQDTEHLLWDKTYLQQAVNEYVTYQEYNTEQLNNMPINLKVRVEKLALERLELTMVHLFQRAQRIERVPQWTIVSRLEREILPQVQSLTEAEELLTQLLTIFKDLGFTRELDDQVTYQANYLLREVDKELLRAQLYMMYGGNFSWWNGQRGLAIEAYGVSGPDELEEYLSFQHERISLLAREYAFPVIAFLSARTGEATSQEITIFNKWQTIINELNDYDNKKPGSSLSRLENFIRSDLDQVTLDNHLDVLANSSAIYRTMDYFHQLHVDLHSALINQIEILAEDAMLEHYTEFTDYFNSNIAGRFPFIDDPVTPGIAELEPEALYDFYTIFDRRWQATRDVLTRRMDDRSDRQGETIFAISFIDQMAAMRALIVPFLQDQQLPIYDFDVIFRVNQEREKGANNIIDWTLFVDNQPVSNHDSETSGRWEFGQDVRMSLRWAKNSPIIPLSDTAWPNLLVSQGHANFEYNNNWGLIGLIKMHTGTASDFIRAVDPQPHTLKFQVRTEHQTDGTEDLATVFIRTSLTLPGKQERLVVPEFPTQAPSLRRP